MIDDFGIFSPHFYFHFSASEVLWYSRHICIYRKNILVDQCGDVHNLRSDIHDTWLLFLFNPRSSFRFTVQLKLFINLSICISSRLPIIKYWFLLHKTWFLKGVRAGGLCLYNCDKGIRRYIDSFRNHLVISLPVALWVILVMLHIYHIIHMVKGSYHSLAHSKASRGRNITATRKQQYGILRD